ncbi:MAG TPA: alanine racemase [Acholeplasmatales bacterium]|nr:alanine racemase [Acholeplasmatales bacterium]
MYPRLLIDFQKLRTNAETILKLAKENGITSFFLVTKVLAGYVPAVEMLAKCGFTHLADSRIQNLKKFATLPLPKVMLRLPMISEAGSVVRYADISLNSELLTIAALNDQALRQNKVHGIILMFDLGDLREGLFYQDAYLETVEIISKMAGIKLLGIGTNLTCYGGIIPTPENLQILLDIKKRIKEKLGISLELVSGGNSSTIPLLINHTLPKGINNLRIGEAIMLGRETAFGTPIPGTYPDAFVLEAELIESQTKPSYPIGTMGMNSFGEIPKIEDLGLMKRGILAIGKQDVAIENLFPVDENVEVLGGSSDHLLVNLTKANHILGNRLSFLVNYPGLLQLMTSEYVKKNIKKATL